MSNGEGAPAVSGPPTSIEYKETFLWGSVKAFGAAIRKWRWVPSSLEEHEEAERHVLQTISAPYEQRMVELPSGEKINTLYISASNGTDKGEKTNEATPPVVMLHGYGGGIGSFVGNYDEMSKYTDVFAIDMIGFGRSSNPHYTHAPAEEAEAMMVRHLDEWASTVGLRSFVLFGHSFGGYVAANYALKHPEKVRHLILADPWGVPKLPETRRKPPLFIRAVATMAGTNPLAFLRRLGPFGPLAFERIRPQLIERFSDAAGGRKQAMLSYIYHCCAQPVVGGKVFRDLMIGFGWAKRPLIERLGSQLSSAVPVSILYGENTWMDSAQGRKIAEELFATRPTQFHIIPDAGHNLMIDNRGYFGEILRKVYLSTPAIQ